MRLRAVCIDDEQQSIDRIVRCCRELDTLIEVVGTAGNADDGTQLIAHTQPDVVFLDMEMPGKTGLEMLGKSTSYTFEVVVISAHANFAFDAYQKHVFHYLLKPFSIQDMRETIERIHQKRSGAFISPSAEPMEVVEGDFRLSIHTLEGTHVVDPGEVLWCEADGSYTIIHLADGQRILASKSIRHFDKILAGQGFMRVHKSSLVNLKQVAFIDHNGGIKLQNSAVRVQVSVRKRQELYRALSLGA